MLRNVLLLCLGITLSNAQLNAQELIRWHDDLHQARQVSQQYKVPILIHFYGDNCLPCKTLEKNVFTRPEVASTLQRYFVPVQINATQDRRTAAQYGVHSWPADVFVAPDGKILTQGISNQNPDAYLQNLQSVAVMNRDRNIMLAGNASPSQPKTPPAAAPGAPAGITANPYSAASQRPQVPGEATAAAPYGRLATTSLQQAAPGRDQAPTPYSNPSSGAGPYGPASATPPLAAPPQSTLPSPTWNGQSAHGQATGGAVGAGPLANTSGMTVAAATPGTSPMHKDVNLPQSAQLQAGSLHRATVAPTTIPTLGGKLSASASVPGLSAAPSVPGSVTPARVQATGPSVTPVTQNSRPAQGAVVENPHFATPPPLAGAQGPTAHMVSVPSSVDQVITVAEPQKTASVPALNGYCPVALLAASQWIEGKPEHAIRHRGRVYFLSTAAAAQTFLAEPDSYCPVLSGYDPLILLRDGALVEGSVYTGLKDATQNRILLFSSPENKKHFQDNYDQLASELDSLLTPVEAKTATAPVRTLSR